MILGIKQRYLLCGVLITVASCATNEIDPQWQALLDKPAWVAGESSKYPAARFFTGHGVSASLQIAKTQAMQDLTETYFASVNGIPDSNVPNIMSESLVWRHEFNTYKNLYQKRIIPQRYIAEIWQDPTSKAYHVLSIIDRVKVAYTIQLDIERLEEQVGRMIDKAETQVDSLQRIAITNIAIEKIKEQQQLFAAMKILRPELVIQNRGWTEKQLQSQINHYLSGTTIMPVLEKNNPSLLDALAGGVRSAGFVVNYNADPDYILKASFDREQIRWNDGVYTLQGKLSLELWDGKTRGQVRGKTNWPIEVTAIDRTKLEEALLESIRTTNQQKLRSAFIQFETY